ncbi:pyridoxal-phosphate-dependent aminotransferase family protein [Ancylobacter amanitiformis]|uniref:Aspartate aminotransferase-like enzyme n=1 Tax=Ancylobacter amanitiformis TaxID=217069 RepID=A0ABU0LTV1_9HYPH|nr:aminotransferase class V-fold PLP-dependent enzyme [Ancylobacter amanitiformis]MDQ0512137.1 aspartate aminotransferase-like enzyme [Ancylobacter amanitiformis]
MTPPDWTLLLDPPPFPALGYRQIADRLAGLFGTKADIVFVQAEAVVALEAVAASLARPGLPVLNIVTSPYGVMVGGWLRRAGAEVIELTAAPAAPIEVEAVAAALDRHPRTALLALVHAESASGILNPLPEILALARPRGIVTVVDAVASAGGHALDIDALGIDVAVIGPQKALGGPAGLSAISVSERAWALAERPDAPTGSILSLRDLKQGWLDTGRGPLPGMPAPLEWHALAAALDRIERGGLTSVIARHALAAVATRRAVQRLGLKLWPERGAPSNLVTAAVLPAGMDRAALLAALPVEVEITACIGPGTERLIRLNHTGPRAAPAAVARGIEALGVELRGAGLPADIEAALAGLAPHA